MSLCNTFRSFTILLLIELAVLESQVNAFTIKRIQGTNNSETDLIESESALQTKSDITLNDVKVIEIKHDGIQKIVPIETTAKTEDIKKSVGISERATTNSSTASNSKYEEKKETVSSSVLTSSTIGEEDATSNNNKTTDVQHTTLSQAIQSLTGGNESASIATTTATTTILPLQPDVNTIKVVGIEVTNVSESKTVEVQPLTMPATNSSTNVKIPIQIKDTITTKSEAKHDITFTTTQLVPTTIQVLPTNTQVVPTTTQVLPTTTQVVPTTTQVLPTTTQVVPTTTQVVPTTTQVLPTTNQVVPTTTQIRQSMYHGLKTTEDINTTTAENMTTNETVKETDKSTESLAGEQSSATAIPYWKKYTVIERKRISVTTEKDTVTSTDKEELVPAGSAQSSVSLEKTFSITSDIPSLEKLKNDLLERTSKLSSTENEQEIDTSTPTSSETSSTMSTDTNDRTSRIEVVSSKRAGFLDLSSRPTAEATTDGKTETIIGINSTTLKIIATTGIPQITTTLKKQFGEIIDKNEPGMASQSQLAEDAINEELMKEEVLNDNVANAKRYIEERLEIISAKTSNESMKTQEQKNQDISGEDKLSVKPINADKKSALYTVSPNYKPLKKIDVVPPKPFLRNPDDNSWRNESLSSLGIVFKAKNSSKPFTQVLKNRTETEWNSLLEKYHKDIEPELRERLVRISETRKRKKKVGKFGETLYTDYEESNSSSESAGVLNSYFPENVMLTDMRPISEDPPRTPMDTDILREKTKETTTWKVYINTDTEMATTIKPNKLYNSESYDTEDEDADYVTLPNFDIKKFVTSKEGDKHKSLPETPILQFLPERKPTIQYFPPRSTKKVPQVNEYDDLQNKLNQYVVKTTPKKIPMNYPTMPTYPNQKVELSRQNTERLMNQITSRQKPIDMNKNTYLTNPREVEQTGFDGYNRGTYVVKHLRDFLNEAAKETDDDRNPPSYVTNPPLRGVTTNELKPKKVKPPADYDDYEAQFRHDVLQRFVENFNQNSDRFKVDFPILYNTSVVHSKLAENGKVQASSSAFVKRLYDEDKVKPGDYAKSYDPNCDRTVDLSPAYELHYYVPEEEEKEEVETKSLTLPYRFSL